MVSNDKILAKLEVVNEAVLLNRDQIIGTNKLLAQLVDKLTDKKPVEKKDVDFEKVVKKSEVPKPVETKESVKGTKIEFKFEEYINREGESKSYVIFHPDSDQMVKYIAKSLILNGGPDEDGNLYLKKGSSWVLEKDWVVKKAK